MLEHAGDALVLLLQPFRLAALFGGMLAGMLFGMLPGLGGVSAVSILLPFIYALDELTAMAVLLGALAVVYTSDTITSVLVGAPGSPASAPTAIEGHALAKEGKAAQALTVGFLSSTLGGIVGAIVLTLAIPVAAPLVLLLGTAELFMLTLVGLYYATSLLGGDPVKGLLAGCLGVALGLIGPAPAAAEFRFTFDQAYLLDGISLAILALGLFGIVEAMSMLAEGGGISRSAVVLTEWRSGVIAAWRSRWLALRGALIGVIVGIAPAMGANASTWVAYAHAVRSTRDKSRFGRGELRGIAAAESANNATIIADLVPTMLFSVPGGPAAAIFLGALFSFGFYPGPRFVSERPEVMFLIVWSVALASVAGTLICFGISPYIARLTRIRFALIAAPLILVMVLGSLQATNSIGDLLVLVALGLLGWMMKRGGWPRAPVLVGFVLAKPMEQYFWLAEQLYGWTFLIRPAVAGIALLIVVPIALQLWKRWRRPAAVAAGEPLRGARDRLPVAAGRVSTLLSLMLLGIFLVGLGTAIDFAPDARLLPMLAIVPGTVLAALAVMRDLRERFWGRRVAPSSAAGAIVPELRQFLSFVAYVLAIWLLGFRLATGLYLLWVLIMTARMRPHWATGYGAIVLAAALVLQWLMHLSLAPGLLTGLG